MTLQLAESIHFTLKLKEQLIFQFYFTNVAKVVLCHSLKDHKRPLNYLNSTKFYKKYSE